MEFLRNIGESVNSAVDFVVEKNKKFNRISKIKKFIKRESNSVIKSYIKLGKHYYNELRDVPNYEMQKVCNSIDNSKREIKRLQEKLVEINNEDSISDFNDLWDDVSIDADLEMDLEIDTDEQENDIKDSEKKTVIKKLNSHNKTPKSTS